VRELIRSRLARLPLAAQAVLGAAAVLGRQAGFDRLRQVSGQNEDQALAGLEVFLAGRLLRPADPDCYAFTHDKIRDVVYAEAGLPRQQVYHRRAGAAGAGPCAGSPRFRIPYWRALAVLAQADGDESAARAHWREAAALAKELGLPIEERQISAALARLDASD